jgi:cation:H+ antiporter
MIFISILLVVMGYTGNSISRLEGVILWFFFIIYMVYLFMLAKNGKEENEPVETSTIKLILFAIIGAVVIVLGSNVTVDAATAIAHVLGLSERFIGLTIVALGTSLPELFTSVVAAKKGNADIAIGNIVGSNIFNILLVVGLSALIVPVPFAQSFRFDMMVAILAGVLLLVCSLKGSLKRWAGILMLLSYVAYFAMIW